MPCVYKDIKECFCKKGTNSHTETTILERHVEFDNEMFMIFADTIKSVEEEYGNTHYFYFTLTHSV